MDRILILVFAAALVTTVAAQDPEIVDEIWPEVKPVGRTARLNCTVANKLSHVVTYEHMDTNQIISLDNSIDLSYNPIEGGKRKYEVQTRGPESRITYMLIIRRLRQQDAGRYRCYVKIQALASTKWPSKIGSLTVQVAPSIRPGETTTVLVVDPFSNSNLTCSATGIPAPNITWTRSDGFKLPTGGPQFRVSRTCSLSTMSCDMGMLLLVNNNNNNNNIKLPAEHLAEVLVFHPPTVRVVQDSVGQAQNRRFWAKLECITQGYPAPTVRWERIVNGGRSPINDDDKFDFNKQTTDNQNLKAGEEWYTLKVKNVQANDYTDYFCIATNTKGSSQSTITMFETTECQGPNCPSLPSSKATEVKVSLLAMAITTLVPYVVIASDRR
ncbi:protein amalgam-like [Haliotis rubra]|uniref:protein amalgam-like n=1 Tax=Haliotis rubra TaxID=36100 RepID=UPI001EE6198E|nr:protein amalgam-like [Haliotis rubra]